MKFTEEEQLAKIKAAKTAEELIAIAKTEGIEATEEQIRAQFDAMHKEGELADDELDNVAGGCGDGDSNEPSFKPGDRVRVTAGDWKGRTGTSNGYNYTVSYTVNGGLASMVWVKFDDNGKIESVDSDYLEHI